MMMNVSGHPNGLCQAGYIQFPILLGNIEANVAAVRDGLKRLNPVGPGILVLPELWATGFAYDRLPALALETPRLLRELQAEAQRYTIHLAGSLPEAVLTEVGTTLYNTLYIVGPDGLCGQYRKQQLFAPMAEDAHFTPGDDPQPIATSLGLIGPLVCFDLRFPELAQHHAAQGAGLLVVSAEWPAARLAHWRALLAARAIENQCFVVACNTCGTIGQTGFAGHSMVIGPEGCVLAQAGGGPEAVLVELELGRIAEARQRFRTVGVSPHRHHDADKVVELAPLAELVARYKAVGRRVVFTNGCFDILHQGHVTYLEAARQEGDLLIVGLNSDRSVRALGKGDDRPVNREESRARVLAALGCVDFVVIFDEETPQRLITSLMPNVLVKGGDWPVDTIVGAPEVLANGGRVLSIPLVENFSTTSLIGKIRKIS
ncbi:MAG TPA: D-glycero-beta-D-manno-heptose 1-phosphate adenylyltransferase [Desulfurivibrionaceae bacterium]|nr:D-glycero-beta-D-manno-heptose 1-phosphate adenylyltransferase [Desulfurivibrionaceae bacterium]